jgi:hypothetical protein
MNRAPTLEPGEPGSGITIDSAEKPLGMLRRAQHERKILNVINPSPVRPEALEGQRRVFQQNHNHYNVQIFSVCRADNRDNIVLTLA